MIIILNFSHEFAIINTLKNFIELSLKLENEINKFSQM